MKQSSDDFSSYSFNLTSNVVAGAWVSTGTRTDVSRNKINSNATGSGSAVNTESVGANETSNVTRSYTHKTSDNSSSNSSSTSTWINNDWSLSSGDSDSSGNGTNLLQNNGTGNYNRTVEGGSVSGTISVYSSNDSAWSSTSSANVANGVWVYAGTGGDTANTSNNRTLNASGNYSFNNDTFKQNGTVTEYTFDSDSSDSSGSSNLSPDGTWVLVGGDSLAESGGISTLTYTNSVVIQNVNITVNNTTYTGNQTDSVTFGTKYNSNVTSHVDNGAWSNPTGTGDTSEFITIRRKVSGGFNQNTIVHDNLISGTTTFDHTASYKDSIARHYSLDANGSWVRAGNNTYHGDIDVVLDLLFNQSNVSYTRTPCVTEISGSGTINGNISVTQNHVIKFHGDLTYDTTGSSRSVTNGTAWYTDTDKDKSNYAGNGTWSRPEAGGQPLTGTMSESGSIDNTKAYRFDYTYQPGTWLQYAKWKLTGGTANVTLSSNDQFDSEASRTSVIVDDSTTTSNQGVAIYYVGFNLDGSQSTGFTDTGGSAGSLTTISRQSTRTVTTTEKFHSQSSTTLTQNGTLFDQGNSTWGWSTTGNATSTASGTWKTGQSDIFNGTAVTTWSKNDASLTATSTLDSRSSETTVGGWETTNTYEFRGGVWTPTGSNLTKTVDYDQSSHASGTSNLTATGVSVSLEMSASRTDDSSLTAYFKHTVSGSDALTVWGHNGTSTVDWTTSANLTVNSGCSTNTEYFNSSFNDSLTTNSTWSQINGGTVIGENNAIYSRVSNYSGGTSSDYGGSSSYSGGENWTWSDPNLSTYDASALADIRITPNDPPSVGPVTFRSEPNVAFVKPPAMVEDPEATAAAEQEQSWEEWALDQGIGFIPVIGSARDAYRAYLKGDKIGLAFNLGMLAFDVLTLGGGTAAKVGVKSAIRTGEKVMAVAGKKLASFADDAVKFVGNKIDDVGKRLVDDVGSGARSCQFDVASNKWTGCFAAGTPILTPLGSKPIEEIEPGDWVLAQDESDPDAVPSPRLVEKLFRNLSQMMTLRVGGHEIETTPEHPFWVRDKGWTPAGEIEPGDELRSHDGQWIPLDSKEFTEDLIPVFNMRVAEDHTYFVGSPLWGFSVWAHNTYVSIYKAPARGKGSKLYKEGFHPDDFSLVGGDNSAYFTKDRSLAQEYAKYYGEGVIEVQIPKRVYNSRIRKYESLYLGGPRIEIRIPHSEFDVLNEAKRILDA